MQILIPCDSRSQLCSSAKVASRTSATRARSTSSRPAKIGFLCPPRGLVVRCPVDRSRAPAFDT